MEFIRSGSRYAGQNRTGEQRCWIRMLCVFPGGRKGRGIDRLLRDREVDRCVVRMKQRFFSKSIRIGFRYRIFKLASSRAQLRRFALSCVASPHVSRGYAVELESIQVLGKWFMCLAFLSISILTLEVTYSCSLIPMSLLSVKHWTGAFELQSRLHISRLRCVILLLWLVLRVWDPIFLATIAKALRFPAISRLARSSQIGIYQILQMCLFFLSPRYM